MSDQPNSVHDRRVSYSYLVYTHLPAHITILTQTVVRLWSNSTLLHTGSCPCYNVTAALAITPYLGTGLWMHLAGTFGGDKTVPTPAM